MSSPGNAGSQVIREWVRGGGGGGLPGLHKKGLKGGQRCAAGLDGGLR